MNFLVKHIMLWISVFTLISCAAPKDLPTFHYTAEPFPERIDSGDFKLLGNNLLRKNSYDIWELYLEGNPLERGLANGNLTEELMYEQEKIFVSKIEELVPSKFQQNLVRGFLKFFNRKLHKHVTEEYTAEIYGISEFTSEEFNLVAPVFWRTLYFHAAHDIGHALQDLAMVGCTSFAAWGENSADGKLILGRNFDFYINDEFSENKIIAFINPDEGHKHAIVTWPGFVGAVSGMNEKGITVTINAGKSSIPLVAKTPISLVAREILQYAGNFEEAIEIAKKREVFVAESIMVGSAEERSAILIEVSPRKFDVYRVESSADLLVCSNHFQSEIYQSDKKNQKAIAESHSQYRFEKMHELIAENPPVSPEIAADFLRNKSGLNDLEIGYGNEKAINQLLSHHAVIFKPEDRLMWVSANPYQLGAFVAYDLNEVFEKMENGDWGDFSVEELIIPEDEFLHSAEFQNYLLFKKKMKRFETDEIISEEEIHSFIQLNPEFWKTYFLVGEYYFGRKNYKKALENYKIALEKEITTVPDREFMEKRIRKSERKMK